MGLVRSSEKSVRELVLLAPSPALPSSTLPTFPHLTNAIIRKLFCSMISLVSFVLLVLGWNKVFSPKLVPSPG